jgi:hypothetical protein
MSKSRTPQQPKTRSAIGLQAHNRPGGIHRDQKKRTDWRAHRRDRSYRHEDY